MLALVLALVVLVLAALVVGHGSAVYILCAPTPAVPQQYPSFILGSSNILGAFFIRAETVNSNFQRRARPSRRSKAAPTAHCPLTPAPITAPTRTLDMAGTGASPSASDISNALANGQDIAEPFQKRRRKSSGNGADVGDDAHDRSGRDQAETEDQGTLGARGRDGVPLEGMGSYGVYGWLWMPNLCRHLVGMAQRVRTSALSNTISRRGSKRALLSDLFTYEVHLYNNTSICMSERARVKKRLLLVTGTQLLLYISSGKASSISGTSSSSSGNSGGSRKHDPSDRPTLPSVRADDASRCLVNSGTLPKLGYSCD